MDNQEVFYLNVSGGLDERICRETAHICDEVVAQRRQIKILICSTGGLTRPTIMLSHFLEELGESVTTYGNGRIESGAVTVFVGGNRRILHPNCFIHVHPSSMTMNGSYTEAELLRTAEILKRDRQEIDHIFAKRTTMSKRMRNQVFVNQGKDMSPCEAIKLGIAHEVDILKIPVDAEQYSLHGERD